MARKVNHEQNLCIQAYGYMKNLRPLNAEIIHIPNGGARGKNPTASRNIGRAIKAMGGKAGYFDYQVNFFDGTFGQLEAKLETKKHFDILVHHKTYLSPQQVARRDMMREKCGDKWKFYVFRNTDEFISALVLMGVEFAHKPWFELVDVGET